MSSTDYPLHWENRENGPGNLDFFLPNTRKNGIWFAQIVNSLILKVKDISILAARISIVELDKPAKSVLCMYSHKSHKSSQGKFSVGQGKQGI